jgi:hypothetical protein
MAESVILNLLICFAGGETNPPEEVAKNLRNGDFAVGIPKNELTVTMKEYKPDGM